MTTLLLSVVAIAFLFEVAGLLSCAIRNVPFGRVFGAAVFVQLSIPLIVMALAFGWDCFSPASGGVEPLAGTGFDRGFQLYLLFLAAGFVATLVAGSLGFHRVVSSRR